MKFVRTTDGRNHMLAYWSGFVMWMVCGQIIDMQRDTIMLTDRVRGNPGRLCGECADIEAGNAYIAGASK